MNILIDREILLENLNTIARGLPVRSPMPILTGIKMYATNTDLYMTSSNSDISVEVVINDQSLVNQQPGQTVVTGKVFIDIIRKINSKKINLYLSDYKVLVIKADRGEYKLQIMDPVDNPKIDFVLRENPLVIDADVLKGVIRETVFATATSEKKPILTGVNLRNVGGKLIATATDSFRLSQNVVAIDPEYKDFNITVPNKSSDELLKAIDQYGERVTLYFGTNKLLVSFKNITFQTRFLDGNYPDTSRLIPAEYPIV
jgi:DNA polymerase-3 subunit beta